MSRKSRICVEITGGLGNQLFQLAAANSLRENNQEIVQVEWSLGKPRLNPKGLPDLFDFELPAYVKLAKRKRFSWLPRKTFGYLLRMGYAPRGYERIALVSRFLRIIGGIVLFMYFGTKRSPLVAQDLGYSSISAPASRFFLVGYFQSFKYFDSTHNQDVMKRLRPIEKSERINQISQLAAEESPLIVHFRFGDYLLESGFGIPDETYYFKAIQSEWISGEYNKIWVFSDDLKLAKQRFPREYIHFVRWIEPISESSVLNLESMRYGKGYVIANSTFSYWAAMLAYNEQVRVVAPTPWFRNTQSPNELIPKNWKLIPGWKKGEEIST